MQDQDIPRLALGKKQHGIVARAIEHWRHAGLVDRPLAERLSHSIVVASFDWQRTARYAFITSIVCIAIAVGAVLADAALMRLLMRIFTAPAIAKCVSLAVFAGALFWFGLEQRTRRPHRVYRNEAILFLGVLALAGSVYFLGMAVGGGNHYSVLFLVASVLYLLLGLWFPSKQVWVFGLLSLGAWMGTETGYVSGYGMYFLGMNYPLRFVVFGAVLVAAGIAGERVTGIRERLRLVSPQTKVVGLLNLFIALWIMSIFGNYGDMNQWHKVRQYELVHWALAFGAVAVAAVWYGLREDDGTLRGFGLTFAFINLYTRFFEYFWDALHKAVFFAVLALTFWLIGTKAETIWHLGQRKGSTS